MKLYKKSGLHLAYLFMGISLFLSVSCTSQINPEPLLSGLESQDAAPLVDHSTNTGDDLYEALKSRRDAASFVRILDKAMEVYPELRTTLKGKKAYTLLVPEEEYVWAFLADHPEVMEQGDLAYKLLAFHILPGSYALETFESRSYETLYGEPLNFQVLDAHVKIQGVSHFLKVNDLCSNGYLHVIDEVLIP